MKKIFFVLSALVLCSSCGVAEEEIFRERIEWCDIWVVSANKSDKPRILLVGDSITKGYFSSVEKQLGGVAYCAKLATSACISDPAFHQQLELMLNQYTYDVIHLNNGLHGFEYGDEAYESGYRKALETMKQLAPSAKVVLVLSTPLQSTSNKAHLTPTVDRRNQIVGALAKEYGLGIDNLYSISKGHPEFYKDPYHYKPEAIELQGEQVASVLKAALQGRK